MERVSVIGLRKEMIVKWMIAANQNVLHLRCIPKKENAVLPESLIRMETAAKEQMQIHKPMLLEIAANKPSWMDACSAKKT